MKPSSLTADEVAALTRRHAELELAGDYDPLLATLVDEPVFEFHPPGGQLIGGETLRRYYTRFLAEFMPRVEETILIGEWSTSTACVHEYQLVLRVDGKLERHQLMGSIYASGDRLGGERLYGSAGLMDLMLGPFVDELVPITGRTQWALPGQGE
jgi:hypothetical protein